jgi:hypothetical protein
MENQWSCYRSIILVIISYFIYRLTRHSTRPLIAHFACYSGRLILSSARRNEGQQGIICCVERLNEDIAMSTVEAIKQAIETMPDEGYAQFRLTSVRGGQRRD